MNQNQFHKNHKKAIIKSAIIAQSILIFSLLLEVIGYHCFFNLRWIDSLLNAFMILTSMKPVDKAVADRAKLFSSFYAL